MDFTEYSELKLSITCVALSTAAVDGSTKQKCLILGDIFFEWSRGHKTKRINEREPENDGKN